MLLATSAKAEQKDPPLITPFIFIHALESDNALLFPQGTTVVLQPYRYS